MGIAISPSATSPVAIQRVGRLISGPECEWARTRAGLSVRDLALLSDVSVDRILRIESGGGFTIPENVALKYVLHSFGQIFVLDPMVPTDEAPKPTARRYATKLPTRPKGRLNEQAVIEIRGSSLPYAELARRFGVSAATVSDAKAGKSWRRVSAGST